MIPLSIIPYVAGAAVLAYAGYSCYSAGQANVQGKWDAAKVQWLQDKSDLQEKITLSQRGVLVAQKEAQDANFKAQRDAQAAIDANRTRTAAAAARLQQHADQLSKRLAASADDSAALRECKTIASTYQGLFGSCTARYRDLGAAAALDLARARASGLECERNYDAAEGSLKKLGEIGKSH